MSALREATEAEMAGIREAFAALLHDLAVAFVQKTRADGASAGTLSLIRCMEAKEALFRFFRNDPSITDAEASRFAVSALPELAAEIEAVAARGRTS